MELQEVVNLSVMLDLYGKLLTEKECKVLDMYVNSNMSYAEIAESESISKNAVMCFIKSAEEKLDKLENALHLLKNRQVLENALNLSRANDIKTEINKVLKGE